jgi:hypothetical protein
VLDRPQVRTRGVDGAAAVGGSLVGVHESPVAAPVRHCVLQPISRPAGHPAADASRVAGDHCRICRRGR